LRNWPALRLRLIPRLRFKRRLDTKLGNLQQELIILSLGIKQDTLTAQVYKTLLLGFKLCKLTQRVKTTRLLAVLPCS